ncbi:MAG: hypothetical protein HYV07_02450 [Deltaproteobacteria bacterium]|nr:hypothetical protein [Deltaproteobacteria bacterium]
MDDQATLEKARDLERQSILLRASVLDTMALVLTNSGPDSTRDWEALFTQIEASSCGGDAVADVRGERA